MPKGKKSAMTCILAADSNSQNTDPQKFPVKIYAMRDGKVKKQVEVNGKLYTLAFNNTEKCIHSLRGRPILCALIGGDVSDWRSEHNGFHDIDKKTGNRGDFSGSDAERIQGYVNTDNNATYMEIRNGVNWGVLHGFIDARYGHRVVEKLKSGSMPVSIETFAEEGGISYDDVNMIQNWNEWSGSGVTLMGSYVAPAVEGAHSMAASADSSWMEEYKNLLAMSADSGETDPPEPNTANNAESDGSAFSDTKNTGGGKKHMGKDKEQLRRELQSFFENSGYDVLAFTESGSHVMVLNRKTGDYREYAMSAEESTFNEKRLGSMSCTVSAAFSNGETAELGLGKVLAPFSAMLLAANAAAEAERDTAAKATERATSFEASMAKMTEERNAERIADTLAALNAYHDETPGGKEKISEEAFNALAAEVGAGKYNNAMDGEKWNGKEAVRSAYDALYGRATRETEKVALNAARSMTWLESGFAAKIGASTPTEGSILKQVVATHDKGGN